MIDNLSLEYYYKSGTESSCVRVTSSSSSRDSDVYYPGERIFIVELILVGYRVWFNLMNEPLLLFLLDPESLLISSIYSKRLGDS